MSALRAGFIGLGRMGSPMAGHVADGGFGLTVYDVRPEAIAALTARGAAAAAQPAAVAAASDVIFVCVPGPKEVEATYFGPHGLVEALRPQATVVECSTIGAAQSRRLAAACAAAGGAYLDAPISGGVGGARDGTLTAMVGGKNGILERARPLLATFARHIVHVGPAGAGHAMKAVNQTIFLGYLALYCEALAVAEGNGISRDVAIDVLRTSVAGNPLGSRKDEKIRAHDVTPGFEMIRALKDIDAAIESFDGLGLEAPIARAIRATLAAAVADGRADRDVTALAEGMPVRPR